MEITYEMIFGAPLGQEIREVSHLPYFPCPAVVQLKNILGPYHAFASLGGSSSRYDEFSRHHAGLAVDIMIHRNDPAMVTLAQHLFMLFVRHQSIMRWRGIIFQHVAISSDGRPLMHSNGVHYRDSDHFNHIHIDWFDWTPPFVTKQAVAAIPLRTPSGQVTMLRPRRGAPVATRIAWSPQADTRFENNATLTDDIRNLMLGRATLAPIDLMAATNTPTS